MGAIQRAEENIPGTIREVWLGEGKNDAVNVFVKVADPDGDTLNWFGSMSGNIRQRGKHQGKSNAQVTMEVLQEVGWSSAPDCTKLEAELVGQECRITTSYDQERSRYQIDWLNPVGGNRLDPEEANKRLAAILGTAAPTTTSSQVEDRFPTEDDSDIPF